MTLDIEKLRAGNPLLDGEGMIPIVEAARTVGMQPESLANELLNDGGPVFTHLHGQSCWRAPVLNDLDRDFGGEFIWNEVEINGERTVHTGTVRVLDGRATLQQVITAGAAQEGVFRDGGPVRFLVCRGHETITEITSYDRCNRDQEEQEPEGAEAVPR
ncbi:hypothetical protein LGN04_27030 [Burkholderia multivorans]|nr:hypothetical protein [Burkholderia multivorans]